MASTYTTIQGDAWDLIAWKLYGNERYMKDLIEANWDYEDVLEFSAGVELNVPEIREEAEDDAPFWRSEAGGADDAAYSPVEDTDE